MARIFLSHATADSAFATKLAEDLRAFGVDVWLDSSHIGPGDFVSRISSALQRDVLLLVLTPNAIESPWVRQEMNAAITREHQKLMLPPIVVMAQPCPESDIPGLWTVYHRYDATSNYMVAVASIVRELGAIPSQASITQPAAAASAPPAAVASAPPVLSPTPPIQQSDSPWWPGWTRIILVLGPFVAIGIGLIALSLLFQSTYDYSTETYSNDDTAAGVVLIAGLVVLLIVFIIALRQAIALKSWRWTLALLLSLIGDIFFGIPTALVLLAFGLFGPRPARR